MATATASYPKPGKLPNNTPVKQLGFPTNQIAKLTPAAQHLNKGDLLALQAWGTSGGKALAPDFLTIADLNSLQKAFKPSPRVFDTTACCCSCCPCCSCSTAAAQTTSIRSL